MSSTVPDDRSRYERARRRVREIRAFYLHVAVFVGVNVLLAHGLATYRWMPFVGKEREKRKIRELMEKDRRDAGLT